jgi:site-specific recombinase XerD
MDDDIYLLNNFEIYLSKSVGLRPSTVQAFKSDARRYTEYFVEHWANEPVTVHEQALQEYIGELREKHLAETTLERVFAGICRYWEFLHLRGRAEEPPLRRLIDIKFRKTLNPTPRLKPQTYIAIMEANHEDLQSIW